MKLTMLLIAALVTNSYGATYYVDFAAGNDASAGSGQGTAWKTIPGTKTADDSTYVTASYGGGVVSTTARVQAGDTFLLKSGTTHNSANGGKVLIDSTYYVTNADLSNPITIRRDSTWGSGGEIMFDGTNINLTAGGFGLIHIKVSGLKIDGGTDRGRRGIVFYRSTYDGISGFPTSTDIINGPNVYNCFFSSNGVAYSDPLFPESTEAGLRLRQCIGPALVYNCEFDGGSNYFQGICIGDNGKFNSVIVSNCIAYAHAGDNDSGIGMKGYGTNMVFIRCTNWWNYKGWDLGCKVGGGAATSYKVIDCCSRSNHNGINMNGPPNVYHPYAGPVDFYIINSLIHDNIEAGSRIYHGPMNFHCIGNIYYRNGGSVYGTGNLGITSDNSEPSGPDIGVVNARVYNTILYKPSGTYCNLFVENYCPSNNYSLESDYNSWTQTASEFAVKWSGLSAPACFDGTHVLDFSYGTDGPGHASGNWYSWYSKDTTPPIGGGTGHLHSEPHSKGTGSADTTSPPFSNVSTFDFALTVPFPGVSLVTQPWYIPEMGFNADGSVRNQTPDMGPQDVGPSTPRGYQKLRNMILKK
jgi:hypothetical protein